MPKATISDVRLKAASNGGFIVSYCKRVEKEKTSKGCYDNCSYEYPDEAFGPDEKDAAVSRLLELAGMLHDTEDASEEKSEKY